MHFLYGIIIIIRGVKLKYLCIFLWYYYYYYWCEIAMLFCMGLSLLLGVGNTYAIFVWEYIIIIIGAKFLYFFVWDYHYY